MYKKNEKPPYSIKDDCEKRNGGFIMVKRGIFAIIMIAVFSTVYIVGVEAYSKLPMASALLYERITREQDKGTGLISQLTYEETGIKITGSSTTEKLSVADLMGKADTMAWLLSQRENDNNAHIVQHTYTGGAEVTLLAQGLQVKAVGGDGLLKYCFTIVSQEDTHHTHYELTIIAEGNRAHLDQQAARAYTQLKQWQVAVKESLYFKGSLPVRCKKVDYEGMKTQLFSCLKVQETNRYEDESMATTCAYYGYSPDVKTYYKEADGRKTNVQLAFTYNEIKGETTVIIAFPFYNEVF